MVVSSTGPIANHYQRFWQSPTQTIVNEVGCTWNCWYCINVDWKLVIKQKATSYTEWMFFSVDICNEWSTARIGFRSTSVQSVFNHDKLHAGTMAESDTCLLIILGICSHVFKVRVGGIRLGLVLGLWASVLVWPVCQCISCIRCGMHAWSISSEFWFCIVPSCRSLPKAEIVGLP